eukprot:3941871-Rhodomonas_salina.1
MRLLLAVVFLLLLAQGGLSFSGLGSFCLRHTVGDGRQGLEQMPTCRHPFRAGSLLALRVRSVVPTPCRSARSSALARLLCSDPGSVEAFEERDQANGQLEAAGSKLESEKEDLKTAKQELKAAEGKLEAAEGKLEAAEGKLEAAEGKLEAATDPKQEVLAQKGYELAVQGVERAGENVNTARENVNTARRAVDIALDAVQRAGAGPPSPDVPPISCTSPSASLLVPCLCVR